ncbi:SDR family NAD(P)-dependent oxidoreductase [Alloalcanivorax mobilis]|uniref:SDR family NAD(P)-dependent oxidoreductase n=1 Tax=Alloalcanivorax mobilis TaxID=2019569 RepID=UPI000C77A945|nr:SDR family oxidoreductase [Alloalcanivorax mobilis]
MNDNNQVLRGKTAIVTGSGQNIGKAIAIGLAQAGVRVVINGGRSQEKVDAVVAEIEQMGGEAMGHLCDVSDPDAVEKMVAATEQRFGPVDIAISNVGRRLHQPFLEVSIDDWKQVLETNLSAVFYLDRLVLPGMKERGWGRLIHVSGYDGFTGHILNRAHNIACKAGMHGFSKALAREFGPFGITSNTVVPGAINTTRDWSQYPNTDLEKKKQEIPVRRWGEVDDLAAACLYLCGDGGSFVNGQALHVNGGEFMF